MKPTFYWITLAAFAAVGCVDQRSALRRSQRSDADTPFWNVPGLLGWRPLEGATSIAPPSFLFPTAAVTREDGSLPLAVGPHPGMAPIFDIFRSELVSERGPLEPLSLPGTSPTGAGTLSQGSWSDRVASASSGGSKNRTLPSGDASPAAIPPVPPSLPYAVPVPGKTGYVTLPTRPGIGEIDVMGIPSGTPVEVPAPGGAVQFLVP